MQLTKSNFFLAARGVQLYNGVTPPLPRVAIRNKFGWIMERNHDET